MVEDEDGPADLEYGVFAMMNRIDDPSEMAGAVVAFADYSGRVVGAGVAFGLEEDLSTSDGDCSASNGCGAHIHSGNGDNTSCDDSSSQGGHLYDSSVSDPWPAVTYGSTDENGHAMFAFNEDNVVEDPSGYPFVVHANDGSRVICGVFSGEMASDDATTEGTSATTEGTSATTEGADSSDATTAGGSDSSDAPVSMLALAVAFCALRR